MSDQIRIESLVPQPLSDGRRVTLMLRVSGLPAYGPGAASSYIHFADMPGPDEGVEGEETSQAPPMPNVSLSPDAKGSGGDVGDTELPSGQDRPSSPYPDMTLSILDPYGNQVVTTYIVEHKEPELEFTLHLPAVEPGAAYLARAEMTKNDEIVQVVQVPFELEPNTSQDSEL